MLSIRCDGQLTIVACTECQLLPIGAVDIHAVRSHTPVSPEGSVLGEAKTTVFPSGSRTAHAPIQFLHPRHGALEADGVQFSLDTQPRHVIASQKKQTPQAMLSDRSRCINIIGLAVPRAPILPSSALPPPRHTCPTGGACPPRMAY
jgi:hypothetical protein